MQYRTILQSIDRELARLRAARELLLPLPGAPEAEEPLLDDEPAAELSAETAPVPVTRVKMRQRRERTVRRPVPVEVRALAREIPAGPVAVPPRERVAVVAPPKPAAAISSEPPGEGTLDALMREVHARGLINGLGQG